MNAPPLVLTIKKNSRIAGNNYFSPFSAFVIKSVFFFIYLIITHYTCYAPYVCVYISCLIRSISLEASLLHGNSSIQSPSNDFTHSRDICVVLPFPCILWTVV